MTFIVKIKDDQGLYSEIYYGLCNAFHEAQRTLSLLIYSIKVSQRSPTNKIGLYSVGLPSTLALAGKLGTF